MIEEIKKMIKNILDEAKDDVKNNDITGATGEVWTCYGVIKTLELLGLINRDYIHDTEDEINILLLKLEEMMIENE